jgi:glycosyltransferase involved in cell wall biosynthesis
MADVALSIVVPVHNDARNLAICLAALRRAVIQSSEMIVVDDASEDDICPIANQAEARYLRLPMRGGPGAARNAGWRIAQGEVVLFVDSDVVVPPDATRRLLERFGQRPELVAVFGSYDDLPAAQSFYSQFRNLLHHYVHQTSSQDAQTFWAGFGAIRRSALENSGGFDEQIEGMEDVELGMRLASGGARLSLDKSLQVKHLKSWTLASTVSTDVFLRAVPWSRLLLAANNIPPDLNLTYASRLSAVLVAALMMTVGLLAPAALHFRGWREGPLLWTAALLALSLLALNRQFYVFLLRKRGLAFACAAVVAHWFFYFYSGVTFLIMWIAFHTSRLLGKH